MTFSAGIVAYGIIDANIPASVGGGLAGLAAATMMALAKMRVWTVDTSAERRQLQVAIQQAADERTRYVAAQGAQAEEHRRRLRDLEGERARHQQQITAAKVAMDQQFEAAREALIVESMETAVRLYQAGLLNAPAELPDAKILRLPGQPEPEEANAHPEDEGETVSQPVREREVQHP